MLYQGFVKSYDIQIFPSNSTGPYGYTRVVALTGTFGLASLSFIPAGRPIPPGSKRPGSSDPDIFDLFWPLDDYSAIVDLLRNEKPIAFYFDDTDQSIGVTTYDPEPVGENEGDVRLRRVRNP